MKCRASSFVWFSLLALSAGCTRASAASFVPKLDLSFRLAHQQEIRVLSASAHRQLTVGAWLRWTPLVEATYLPERYDLSPSAWLAPCDGDDALCFAEFERDEKEVGQALQEAP